MANFVPLHTGQFIIKPRRLPRRRAVWVGLVVLVALVPYVTFECGRMLSGYSVISSQRERFAQAARISALQTEIATLRRQVSTAQLGRKVDQQSSDAMQQSFTTLQSTLQKQQEELAFYKAIVTPAASAAKEPQVQRLEIQPDAAEHRYLLRLVLIQSMQATSNAQGTVQVQLVGTRQGQSVTLSLEELMVGQRLATLPFAYRYFQTLEQLVELPAEFQPQSVQVELHEGQRLVQHQDFPWQPLQL
jgi:hypothetical protein